MNFLTRLATLATSFFKSIKQYPAELILCILYFVLCVIDAECRHRYGYHKSDGPYLIREVIPVALMYAPAVFAIIFAIRCGWLSKFKSKWATISYYGAIVLTFIPCLFFKYSDYGHSLWFGSVQLTGTYLLVVLLLLAIRWQKDNRLFVADAKNYMSSLCGAALFSGILALVYYALMASAYYLFFDDYMSQKYLAYRICFWYVGYFILMLVFPMLFCFLAARGENNKEGNLNKAADFIVGNMLTPALLCYTVILYLYAAKILFTWNLPKGGLAGMVIAFLTVAFVVNALRPFTLKERFVWFFNYLPYISAVPLVMYWISTIRRVYDYGFTQPRVFLLAFGILITLFMGFMLVKRLNKYLLMACISAVPIFFLAMLPPTSARQVAINSQRKQLDKFLTKYPIAEIKSDSLIFTNITKECLADTAAIKRFASAYNYLSWENAIKGTEMPHELRDVAYGYECVRWTNYELDEPVDLSKYPYYLGSFYDNDFPVVSTSGVTLIDSIDKSRILTILKADTSNGIQQIGETNTYKIRDVNAFSQKSDTVMVVWDRFSCYESPEVDVYGIKVYAKKPYKVKKKD